MKNFIKGDKIIWFIVIMLWMISLIAVFSSGSFLARGGSTGIEKTNVLFEQLQSIAMGCAALLICYFINIGVWRKLAPIAFGISLLMLFVAANVECGFWTILIAHVTFCVSYVTMTVLARLADFDDRIVEAAYDLGAGPGDTFFHVELPILLPGIVAGGLLAFTLSIDDVVITSFVNGAGTNTFPTYVSSMTKHSRNLPAVFALSTLMLIFTCALVGLSKFISRGLPQTTTRKGRQQ